MCLIKIRTVRGHGFKLSCVVCDFKTPDEQQDPSYPLNLHDAGQLSQADHPPRFSRDSPGLKMSVPESRTLSSGRQNVPVLALLS